MFNVMDIAKDESVMSRFPELGSLYGGDDRAIKYVVLMYDSKSPLQTTRDINKRKLDALALAGINENEQLSQGLVNVDSDEIISLVVSYTMIQNSRIWSMIVANEQAFYEYQGKVMQPLEKLDKGKEKDLLDAMTKKSKLLEDMDIISNRLTKYYSQLFPDDDDVQKKIEQTRFTPESIAKK